MGLTLTSNHNDKEEINSIVCLLMVNYKTKKYAFVSGAAKEESQIWKVQKQKLYKKHKHKITQNHTKTNEMKTPINFVNEWLTVITGKKVTYLKCFKVNYRECNHISTTTYLVDGRAPLAKPQIGAIRRFSNRETVMATRHHKQWIINLIMNRSGTLMKCSAVAIVKLPISHRRI